MLRNFSSMAVKGLAPISGSISRRPTVPIYSCSKMLMHTSPFSSAVKSPSTGTICNDAPVGINGMGNVGKLILWNAFEADGVNVVAINQPCTDLHTLANSLKFDSVHGKFDKHIEVCGDCLYIHDKMVKVFNEECPEKIGWSEVDTAYVVESSGKIVRAESAMKHVEAGAKKVIIAGPSIDAPMFVKGMNFEKYDSCMQIVSNASSTTHCAGPLIRVLHDKFGVDSVMMNSTYAQRVVDDEELEYEEVVLDRIVPKSTGAAVTLGKMLPELQGKVMGQSGRFPVSYLELQLFLCRENVNINEIKDEIIRRGECDMKGILNNVDKCVEDKNFINCRYSGVVDFNTIRICDKYVTIGMWFDNEMGIANRVLDLTKHMMAVDKDSKLKL